MSEDAWAWTLFGAELIGLWAMAEFVGRRKAWWGWLIVAGAMSIPWLLYSTMTFRMGFIALSCTWLTVHLINAWRWARTDPDDQ